ncbi:MAG: AAA family ATPase [Deltaproteobacteria bacterium]|nr:AAA family ATPase [Deltaproteobacteria bacterium]
MTPRISDIEIPGMQLIEEIGRGTHSVVYRARRGGAVLAVKVQKPVSAPSEAKLRFLREASVLARVRHPSFAAILEVGEVAGRSYLVRDFIEGQSLSAAVEKGPLPDATIGQIARHLAGALIQVHRHGLVHRDVKPQNIVIDRSGTPILIDFGLAAPREAVSEGAVGTFLYCAPEQTGMLKRPVDARSDLYALGAVLFECATGHPPFQAQDVSEVMRLHAEATPPDVCALNPSISAAMAGVIAKLLAKDPDDRYQTSHGLLADLDKLPALEEALRGGTPLALGTADDLLAHHYDVPLVGREAQLSELQSCWSEVRKGQGMTLIVEGDPGCGKSRLVRELLNRARDLTPAILTAKCSPSDPRPFAPLREAIDEFLRRLRRLPPMRRQVTEERVRAAVGDRGPLLRHFSTSLASLLGDEAGSVLGRPEAQDQFFDALADFLLRLASSFGQGALFIDDVQWLDDASRRVLKKLALQLKEAPLLVIAAARRSAEHAEANERFASDMGRLIGRRLVVGPLSEEAITRLLAFQLGATQVDPGLVRQITSRSGGNPFSVGEYLHAMLDAGLVRPSWGGWVVDSAGIERLQLPVNILDLVLKRIGALGAGTKAILGVAAVVGFHFRLELLTSVCGAEPRQVHEAIAEATRSSLVERCDAGEYHFVHDRVQESLLAELDADRRRDLHHRIAQALDASGGTGNDYTYALARHWSLGHPEKNPTRVYESNLAAGQAALESYANDEALAFLEGALRSGEAAGRGFDVVLEEALGDACARTGRPAKAVEHLGRALEASTEPSQRATLRIKLSSVHMGSLDTANARRELEEAFLELGLARPSGGALRVAMYLLSALAPSSSRPRQLTPPQRQRLELQSKLLDHGTQVYYFEMTSPLFFAEMALGALKPGRQLGPSMQLATSHVLVGGLLSLLNKRKMAQRYLTTATDAAERLGDPITRAHVRVYESFSTHFGGDPLKAEALMTRCMEEQGRWLCPSDYLSGCADLAWNLLMRGKVVESRRWVEEGIRKADNLVEQSGFLQGHTVRCYAGPVLAILGKPAEGQEHLRRFRALIDKTPENKWRWGQWLAHSALFHLEQEDFGEGFEELIVRHRALALSPSRVALQLRQFYVAQAYARLAQFRRKEPAGLERLAPALRDLQKAAGKHPTLVGHALTVAGASKGLQGRHAAAHRLFEKAEALAREFDSPWVRFEVARHRAFLYEREGKPASAVAQEARIAHELAVEHHWEQRDRRLRADFKLEDEQDTR